MRSGKVPTLEYYEAAAYGANTFFVRTLEYFVTKLKAKDAKIGYQAFLEKPLDDLEVFASKTKSKDLSSIKTVFPMGGLNFLRNSATPGPTRGNRKDAFFEFDGVTKNPVYVGRVSILTPEYAVPGVMTCTFIVSSSEAEALEFISEYYSSVREMNRTANCVLSPLGEPVGEFRSMSWDNVILPGETVASIRFEVDSFFASEQLYLDHGLDWKRGMLFAGPPGNGKTTVCRAIASSSPVPVIYCGLQDSDVFGLLSRSHATICQNAPCVAIFEDVDAFGGDPMVRSAFLNLLDGLHTCRGVLTVATTNAPDTLDSSFTGRPSRFDSYHILGNPGAEEREKMLRVRLGKKGKAISVEDLKQIIQETDGLSAASIQEIASCSLYTTLKEKKPISLKTLKEAVRRVKRHMKASKEGTELWSKGIMGFSERQAPEPK